VGVGYRQVSGAGRSGRVTCLGQDGDSSFGAAAAAADSLKPSPHPAMMIPTDAPAQLDIPAAWVGARISTDPDTWRWTLSAQEAAGLEAAAMTFLDEHGDLRKMTRESFPLPSLSAKLVKLRATLIHGIGFEVIRGVPVHRISEEAASAIFYGIGTHIGSPRSQNANGDLLGHVRDIGADSRDPSTRIYQTRERQTFHTDSSDVVGLLCLNEAREGGGFTARERGDHVQRIPARTSGLARISVRSHRDGPAR
jgi:hypothetical protein